MGTFVKIGRKDLSSPHLVPGLEWGGGGGREGGLVTTNSCVMAALAIWQSTY